MEQGQVLVKAMPPPNPSLPPYHGDELLDPERTYHSATRLQRGIAYLLDVERFLERASVADFNLYVQHARVLHPYPNPTVFLGVVTGPNANRLLASGNRWYALASIRQCRCEVMARTGRMNSSEFNTYQGKKREDLNEQMELAEGRRCRVM
ncbi:hypothetical protein HII31_09369 [Pseudocercospora fuligena]|uniref:Uncharacterized protein n=1 Tax=Pseudocercospora fuligena TaxID=685502 RepID=A0A8H6RFQ6_9PEZI|nr:hypothetical protein HII31_09369 [Pseudocercospora fuligena]